MEVFFILEFLLIFYFSYEGDPCHYSCKKCTEYSDDNNNQKCISCKDGTFFVFNTSNCEDLSEYVNYYLNKTDLILYPCDFLNGSNCYECDPYLNSTGKCLSCNQGYKFNSETNECEKCKKNEYSIIINDFSGCHGKYFQSYCDKYITECKPLENDEIICPEKAPIFDNITKSCNEYECQNNGLKNGNCFFQNKKYEDRYLFINWFNNYPKYCRYPSYNIDDSGYLLIELTCAIYFTRDTLDINKSKMRKLYFYNEEGRGLFNEINDTYERIISYDKTFVRGLSTSMILKLNNSDEHRFYLNFENINNNLEMYDIKTGEFSSDSIFDIFDFPDTSISNLLASAIQMFKLKEENKYLIASYYYFRNNLQYITRIEFSLFNLVPNEKNKINIYSLNRTNHINFAIDTLNFIEESKFFIIETKSHNFIISSVMTNYYLLLFNNNSQKAYIISTLFKRAFHKLIFLKDETFFLCFYSVSNALTIFTMEFDEQQKLNILFEYILYTEKNIGIFFYSSDAILLTENKIAFVIQHLNGKRISMFLFNFFDDYQNIIINEFKLNIYEEKMHITGRYSLLFKYKDILGFQFENVEGDNGFVLFGYFNSTDPKQIHNIKKDGLNYKINLSDYLKLQSNIFEYEKRCIKIIEVPNNESGLYLISNVTKDIIKKNDYVDLNTEISLLFAHNGILKQGKYLFKFAGVLEETTFEVLSNYSDTILWSMKQDKIDEKYIEIYNNRRNLNITGKTALVQINVLNDTKVFCDEKYDNTALKNKEGKSITCGDGKFYDIMNVNEITQINPGNKYYYDSDKKIYIKCHDKCKKCSKEYNITNMNCNECYDKFFLRNGNCLEISECDNNYYYDINYDLHCIKKETYCPDFKPYENISTKECIEKCNIEEFNINCTPTNNPISINETYKKIIENAINSNLEELLLKNKEKYIINGNNVTFIFSTSQIEKKELNNIYNSSSIILNKCENILKTKYLIPEESPIPILKIEELNNYSDKIELFYELFHPKNLSQKLDLNSCNNNYIEIRLPLVLKEYKMDLVLKTAKLGYNIFDLNDSFYNDICSIFTYNDSDFSLSERKKLLDLSDENLCMIGCNHSNFDIKTIRSICLCKIDIGMDNDYYSSENKNEINDNNDKDIINVLKHTMISKSPNIKVIKCFKMIFRINIFYDNHGFYILFFMIFFTIIILIFSPLSIVEKQFKLYCTKVIEQMEQIYDEKPVIDKIDKNNDINDNDKKSQNSFQSISTNIIIDKSSTSDYSPKINKKKEETMKFYKNQTSSSRNFDTKISDITQKSISKLDKTNQILDIPRTLKNNKKEINIKIEEKNNQKIIDRLKKEDNSEYYIYLVTENIPYEIRRTYLSEYEIENLSYKYALKIENRNKSEYYFSLLKEKNKIILIFINDTDYNIYSVKISIFIFNFNLTLTINALFFNDEAIYQINQDQGSFNLKTRITRVIYSAIISVMISFVVELIGFTHKNIIKLRNYKDINEAKKSVEGLIKKLKIKYVFYWGIIIFFNIIFFYYITAFCAIYSIIQTHMISDSLISFLLSMSYSIILSMISSIIRVFSLKKENKFRHFIYIISWIISIIE